MTDEPFRLRRRLLVAAGAALSVPSMARAQAAAYPDRPIKVIVPFPPGAGSDILARLVTAEMARGLGRSFVIDNRAGAAGNIGAAAAARAEADGYNLLAAPSSLVASSVLYKRLPFDFERDFEPIAMMGVIPFLLVVRQGLAAASLGQLVALAKQQPDTLTFGSTGIGSAPHLLTESFRQQAGITLRHIPYKGSAPALTDLLADQVDLMFSNLLSVLPQVKAGKLRALAITTRARNRDLPDVPTVIESGYADFDWSTWTALMAPRGTPTPILEKLNASVRQAMARAELLEQLREQGAEGRAGSLQETAAFIRTERARLTATVKAANLQIE